MTASLTELLEPSGGSHLELSAKGLDLEVTTGAESYTIVLNGTIVLYDKLCFMQSPLSYADAQLAALSHLQAQARNLLTKAYNAERTIMRPVTSLKSHPRLFGAITKLAFAFSFLTLSPKAGLEKAIRGLGKHAGAYEATATVFAYGHEFFTGLKTAAEDDEGITSKLAECAKTAHNLSATYSMLAGTYRHNGESVKAMIDILYANTG